MMNNGLMDDLLAAARDAALAGDVPVAAAIVAPDGTVVVLETNRMVRDGNALHHAEILAINAALAKTGMSRLDGYDLWVTLEPCAMCAGAIAHARLRRVYFAAYDVKAGAVESGIRYFDQPSCHHRPEIYGGLSEQAASTMLTEFFAEKR
jgi:tRNA(Arg) A34 adenosine deaminase TadA